MLARVLARGEVARAHALLHSAIAPQQLQLCRLLRDSTAQWLTPSRALEHDLPRADRDRYIAATAAARGEANVGGGIARRRSSRETDGRPLGRGTGQQHRMKPQPRFTLVATTLDAPNAHELAQFYQGLLGWPTRKEEPGWVEIAPTGGAAGLSFQTEPLFTRPQWPTSSSEQQMMTHLDFEVNDLSSAVEHALALGATVADFQPQDDVRVLFDPAGHPFCLFVRTHPVAQRVGKG
ncbi:VOC family protein [Streptomyces sp. NPDC058914]|uniref:VOC family protein n=1 Tax=Streptomyces TaxID=1883 RepID=UPI0036770090